MNEIISGNKIAELADHIFAQVVVNKNFHKGYEIKINNDVIDKIKSNQSIFVKTDFLFHFLQIINKKTNISGLKLITHDSDIKIDNNVLNHMPPSVSKMFSINVCISDKRICPIPIGIANDYCPITLKPKNQNNFLFTGDDTKAKALIACEIANNPNERSILYNYSFDEEVTTIKKVSLQEYERLVEIHDFIFCPEGNGPDTHRIWETLYYGKIPIVKKATWNLNFRDLPILFVDNFLDANKQKRIEFLKNIKKNKFNNEKLYTKYWDALINKNIEFTSNG